MNQDDTQTMENEILAEEGSEQKSTTGPKLKIPKPNIAQSAKNLQQKLKNFKKPKLITIFALFAVVMVVFVLLIVLSSRNSSKVEVVPDVVVTSPKATPQKDPQTTEIEKTVYEFDRKVDNLSNSINNYKPPEVDLKMNF